MTSRLRDKSIWPVLFAAAGVFGLGGMALGQSVGPVMPQGLPVQIVPTYPEPGAPQFSYQSGPVQSGGGGVGGGGGGGLNYNACPGCDPLQTMQAQSWGGQLSDLAEANGINPAALAAMCSIESNCKNVDAAGSSAEGPFQEIASTYTSWAQQWNSANPDNTIPTDASARSDPMNNGIAAIQGMQDAYDALQKQGIDNPTVLDARAYWEWGKASVAAASDNALLSNYVPVSWITGNGLPANATVGYWRQTQINKLGSGATEPLMI